MSLRSSVNGRRHHRVGHEGGVDAAGSGGPAGRRGVHLYGHRHPDTQFNAGHARNFCGPSIAGRHIGDGRSPRRRDRAGLLDDHRVVAQPGRPVRQHPGRRRAAHRRQRRRGAVRAGTARRDGLDVHVSSRRQSSLGPHGLRVVSLRPARSGTGRSPKALGPLRRHCETGPRWSWGCAAGWSRRDRVGGRTGPRSRPPRWRRR